MPASNNKTPAGPTKAEKDLYSKILQDDLLIIHIDDLVVLKFAHCEYYWVCE